MSHARRFRLLDLIPLLIVLATAAGARVGYLLTYADNGSGAGPILVQEPPPVLALAPEPDWPGSHPVNEVEALAHNIKEQRWFGSLAPFANREEQTAHAAPGYPWLLGELQRFLGDDAERTLRWVQCVLGTLTAGMYFLIARLIFPGRIVPLLTGLLTALHPFWIFSTPAINDGALATFLLAACLWLAVRANMLGGALTSLTLGLALAALALVRAALLPFSGILLLWMLRRSRRTAAGWQHALLTFLGFIIGLAPWTVRNVQVFGDIYPIVDSTYVDLWMGNNPKATGGPLTEQVMNDELPAEVRLQMDDPALSQAARYRLLGPQVLEEIRRNPTGTIERRLWAGLYFFFGEDWFAHKQLYRPTAESLPDDTLFPPLLAGSLLVMLLLGVLGWRWTYAWRTEAQPLALAVMWVPLPYLLSHAGSLSGPRLPLDGVLLCYSAFALACLVPGTCKALLRPARTED